MYPETSRPCCVTNSPTLKVAQASDTFYVCDNLRLLCNASAQAATVAAHSARWPERALSEGIKASRMATLSPVRRS